MSLPASRIPSYRLHKPSGQAVVSIAGRDIYLGKYNSSESRAEYGRLIAEFLTAYRQSVGRDAVSRPDLTINEILLEYLRHADGYYVKNGKPTTEPVNIRLALRPLRRLYGHSPAREFGPLRLKTVRQTMIDSGLCRNEVNRRIRQILRAFKWAVGEEMVSASIHHGLQAVTGLRRGRSEVRESEPVRPVPDAVVDAVQPFVSRQVWAIVQLQRLSGMRSGEVCSMRTRDIDMSGQVWVYVPADHKTQHHGRERRVYLGPAAQQILGQWLRDDPSEYLFQPKEAESERRAEQRATRKSRVQPSQLCRRRRAPRKTPGVRYTTDSYRKAIEYGISAANRQAGKEQVKHWHPHQLRHNAATRIRKEFGLEVARAVLGHSSAAITEIYAEMDGAKAAGAMGRIG